MKYLKTPLTQTMYRANEVIIKDAAGLELLTCEVGKANDIVMACNAHDKLVDALKEIAKQETSTGYVAMRALNDVGIS